MPPRSRYRGESNAYDTANNKVYLGDMIWSWQVGNDLTGWTLGGTTVPTIAADGQIDLFDNINLAGQTSQLYISIPNTLGNFYSILHCKFTRQSDDNSLSVRSFIADIAGVITRQRGVLYGLDGSIPQSVYGWVNNNGSGNVILDATFIPAIGVEYSLDLILSAQAALIIIDNRLRYLCPNGSIGTSPLSNTPLNDYRATVKYILFHVEHDAGKISHYRVRDIRVSRLVGVSV